MSITRRGFLARSALAGGAAALGTGAATAANAVAQPARPPRPGRVITPNGVTLPHRVVGGVKVFHLTAEPIKHTFTPGLEAHCWGYSGRTPGPTIEAIEGDTVRIYVTNKLPAPTTIHWHGLILPSGMDGVAGLNQPAIAPGETYRYEFPLRQSGTFMYHPHVDEMTQIGMGLNGMFIVHPRRRERVDRDFAIMLLEWSIPVGAARPDTREMTDFNVLTLNSRVFPGTDPLVAKKGDRVRIRFGNLSAMDNHPIHLHGYNFRITGTDGGAVPRSAQRRETTVLVPVGATRDIEFTADAPGDWAMHCHFTHHVMNQMGHDGPNMLGVDTRGLDAKIRKLLPDYMSMGEAGMSGMGEMIDGGGHGGHKGHKGHGGHQGHGGQKHMRMVTPRNSIPMKGGKGPHGYIDMGGMFTVLKVRDKLANYNDPGWYQAPPATRARKATAAELAADGIT